VLDRARCVTAGRNGADVRADERLPFGPLAEADLRATKRLPVLTGGETSIAAGGVVRSITEKHNPTEAKNPNE
jgi:hypothetical protein